MISSDYWFNDGRGSRVNPSLARSKMIFVILNFSSCNELCLKDSDGKCYVEVLSLKIIIIGKKMASWIWNPLQIWWYAMLRWNRSRILIFNLAASSTDWDVLIKSKCCFSHSLWKRIQIRISSISTCWSAKYDTISVIVILISIFRFAWAVLYALGTANTVCVYVEKANKQTHKWNVIIATKWSSYACVKCSRLSISS